MADNTLLNAGVGGDTLQTDDIGAYKIASSKIALGANNSDDGYVATGNPMPITVISTTPDLALGTDISNVFGTSSVLGGGTEAGAVRVTLANDSTGLISIDDGGNSITVDGTELSNIDTNTTDIPNVIGTDGAAGPSSTLSMGGTESGGNIQELRVDSDGHLQVDVLSGGGTQYTEDAASPADPVGTAAALVRADTPATITSTDGDIVAQRATNYGAAYCQLVTSAGAFIDSVGGGTEYTEDDAAPANPIGKAAALVRADTPAAIASADGDIVAQRSTDYGAAYCQLVSSSGAFIDSVGAGTQYAVDAVAGAADTGTLALVVRDDALTTLTPIDGDYTQLRVTSTGALWVEHDGNVTVDAGTGWMQGYTEDAAGAGGEEGPFMIGRRQDADTSPVGTDGDYHGLIFNDEGDLKTVDKPVASGGLSMHKTISAATTNATNVKASAGQLYAVQVFNTNASARYLKLYDKATAPTVGTDTPVKTLLIPGNSTGAGMVLNWDKGLEFTAGIGFALTTGITDADTGAVAANEIAVDLDYR